MNHSKEAILDAVKKMKPDEMVCIRKLTPRELFRLMGMREHYIDKIYGSGLSKTSMSKLAGNSIVVDCLVYILKPLFEERKIREKKYQPGQQITIFDQLEDMQAKGEV